MATQQVDWFSQNAPQSNTDWFASNAPADTMQAAPMRNATSYLQDAEKDLTEGGSRTIVGKGLGYLQGNGDKGYSGLESGVSPETAQTVGSVPLGLTKMAVGATKGPIKGFPEMAEGALQTATIPTAFVAPEASEAAGELASAGKTALASKLSPTAMKQSASELFQSVAQDANKVPVQLENAGESALKLMDWQKQTNLGPTINKFLNRITNPNQGPLTYEDARKSYQLLGQMSADEQSKLAPAIRRDLTQMVVGLKQDIGNAADQVGKAADYYAAMKDYRTASNLQDWYTYAKDTLAGPVAKGVAASAGAGGVYSLWRWLTGK
jgi:hypothetical protein